jgi:hypothetical protein
MSSATAAPPIAFSWAATRAAPIGQDEDREAQHQLAQRQIELQSEQPVHDRRLDEWLQQTRGDHGEEREGPVQPHHQHEGRHRRQDRRRHGQQHGFLQRWRQRQRRQQTGRQERRAEHDPQQRRDRAAWLRHDRGDPSPVDAYDIADHEPDDRRRHHRA